MLWVALGCSGLRLGCCKNTVFFTCWVALGCSGLLWVAGCNPAATQSNPSATQLGCTGLHTPTSCQAKIKKHNALGCSGLLWVAAGLLLFENTVFYSNPAATQSNPSATQVQPKCNPAGLHWVALGLHTLENSKKHNTWVALGLHLGCSGLRLGCW